MYPNPTVKRVLIAAAVAIVGVAVVLWLANQGSPSAQTATPAASVQQTAYADATFAGNPEPVSRYGDSGATPRVAYAVSPFEPSEPRALQTAMPSDQRAFVPEPLPPGQPAFASMAPPPPPPATRRLVYYRQRVAYSQNHRHSRLHRGRSFNHSAMIVGGSAVGGAVIGGLAGGGKGAGIGALAGGAGGLIYDRATRNK